MLDPETKRKIRELRIPGMIEAVEMLDADPAFAPLTFDDRLRMVIDHCHQEMENAQVARLLRNAHLRLPQADVTNIDYDGRPLDRTLITELATTQFVSRATDVIIEGFPGHRQEPPCLRPGEAGLQARAPHPLRPHARHAGLPRREARRGMAREEGKRKK